MADPKSSRGLATTLWFVAAGLAFIAVGIRFFADRGINWPLAAGGLFCLVIGISAWSRTRQPPPSA